jgi:WD40 repeat protein
MSRAALIASVAGLAFAVPSAAAPVGGGKIAYETQFGGISTVNADGTGFQSLRIGGSMRHSWPRWSPDGSSIAFTQYSETPGVLRLHVTKPNGTGDRVLATGVIALSRQPWSPEGSRISWGPNGGPGDIYTVNADGGDVHRLTTDGRSKTPPVWSPDGSTLAYAAQVGASWELFSVRDDGSAPVQITSLGFLNIQPAWSPNGSSIAFQHQAGGNAIYVVRPDGSELHRVAEVIGSLAGEPVWSPDGTRILYANGLNSGVPRYGGTPGQEIFVVNADGSGERRLTELAPQLAFDAAPTWSPNGDLILFRRGYSSGPLVTMNSDGTCEEGLPLAEAAVGTPSWQAILGGAPFTGSKTCQAVSVTAGKQEFADGSTIGFSGTVRNEGTETLLNVLVKFTAPRNDLGLTPLEPCTRVGSFVSCWIQRLERGQSRTVGVYGSARRVGRDQRSRDVALRGRVEVTADGDLLGTERETDEIRYTPSRCSARDRGRGRIDGTRFPDRICGRRGIDLIHPGLGKDVVDAGDGADAIFARDGFGDRINCGWGRDVVDTDPKDRVARNCERVVRHRY